MPTISDHLYCAGFAVAAPAWDAIVTWRQLPARLAENPARAKRRLWISSIAWSWMMIVVGSALWMFQQRPWPLLGFAVPEGWRLWVAIGLILLVLLYLANASTAIRSNTQVRETVRQQMTGHTADLMPQTKGEMTLFGWVSLAAGFGEEFLFRGYLIWALKPWLGSWGAAAASLLVFAGGHAYQGANGVIRTAGAGLIYTVLVVTLGSLWPAIIIHFLWDLGMGLVAWRALSSEPESPESAGT